MKKVVFCSLLGALLLVGLAGCPTGGKGISNVVGTWKLAMMIDTADPTDQDSNVSAENIGRIRKSLTFGKLDDKGYGEVEFFEERYLPDRTPRFDPTGGGYTVDDNGSGIVWSWHVTQRIKGYYSLAPYTVVSAKANITGVLKADSADEETGTDAAPALWEKSMDTQFDIVVTHEERLYRRIAVSRVVTNGVTVEEQVRDTTGRYQYEYQTVTTEIDPTADMILIRGELARTALDDLLVHWSKPDLVEDEGTYPWKAADLLATNNETDGHGPDYNGGVEGVENYHLAWVNE